MNPYSVLQINERMSNNYLKNNLKAFGELSETKIEEMLINQDEEQQRETLLDELIKVKFDFFCAHAIERARKILPQGVSWKKIEEEAKRNQDLIREAYEMICTQERREAFEKEKNTPVSSMTRAEEFLQRQAKWQTNRTKYVPSMEELEKKRQRNLDRKNSENQFPDYTGDPYLWKVTLNDSKNLLFLDGKNDREQQIIVTLLGGFNFQYNQIETKEGNFKSYANIIGITKLDSKGKIKRSDIGIANLKNTDKTIDREFFKSVFCSDEVIDYVQANNHGFMGSIAKAVNELGYLEYYIEYNGICDTELVTAIQLANTTNGLVRSEERRVGKECGS